MNRRLGAMLHIPLLCLLLFSMLIPSPLVSPLQAQTAAAITAEGGPIRTALLYSQDTSTAQAYETLLEADDFDVTLVQIALPGTLLYLPLVVRGGAGSVQVTQSTAPLAASALPDFSAYDLILVAADTGSGTQWSTEPGLIAAIRASGLPVAGLGGGGYALFGKLGLEIGAPNGATGADDAVRVADFGASQQVYNSPVAVSIPPTEVLTLFTAAQPAIAIPLAGQLTDGIRVAALADAAGQYPILVENDTYLLWGFDAAPAGMTGTGSRLFLNALHYLMRDLALPIKGTSFIPGAGFDPDFLAALGGSLEPLHAFVQLDHVPSPAERDALAAAGVTLQDFLGGTFYVALVDPGFDPAGAFVQAMIRWMGGIMPEWKIDPDLLAPGVQSVAEITTVLVVFHDDVTVQEAEAVLNGYSPAIAPVYYGSQTWLVPRAINLTALAQEPVVRWIAFGPPPEQDANDQARADTGSEIVQNIYIPATGDPTYLGLSGDGVVIGHFERRADQTHDDISPRATSGSAAHASTSSHATHVAGIMIGNGTRSQATGGTPFQWRGHAPEASIVAESYDLTVAKADDIVNSYGAELSNHSYVMTYGTYDAVAALVDTIVRGDGVTSGGDSIAPHLAVWAACNQGLFSQYDNEEGFYSIYAPAKNSLAVGSIDTTDQQLSLFSSKGPTFDGRIKPDVMAPGSHSWNATTDTTTDIWSTQLGTNGYTGKSGTSMAAPATTGVLALMLEQWHNSYGTGSHALPATLKAILVNTAIDMVHTASDASDDNDPDLCRNQGAGGTALNYTNALDPDCWTRYTAGPDYATGYGMINAPAAVAAVRGHLWVESVVNPTTDTRTWTFTVPPGRDELRFTLAWDDEPGSASAANTTARLINDLDLRLIGPDATTHFPFTLNPLPANANLGNGGLDPIDATDLTAAFRGDDDRNNVEQVLVENPAAGTWTVQVTVEGGFPTGDPQTFGLAGDARTLNIVSPQTGNVAEAGDPANPDVIMVELEARNGLDGLVSTLADADVADFSVEIEGTPATIVSGLAVGDQFWLNVLPQSGTYSAGSKYDLAVTWAGYGEDKETNAVLFTEREVTDRAVIVDVSGSMADYDKMGAAQIAARLFIDQSLVGDRIAVCKFSTTASTPYPITEVSADPTTPELNAAKTQVDAMVPTNATAIGLGLLQGQAQVTAAPADFSVQDVLILLSDGMQNVAPLYDTPTVKGAIEPTDTIIHTVAVGPPSAGHHDLLDTIATDNGGTAYVVDTASTVLVGTTLASAPLADVTPSAVTYGTGLDAWPLTLPNRLGDAYKAIAEEILGETRLFEATALADPGLDGIYQVVVPEGTDRVTFALNWSLPSNLMHMTLEDPTGAIYEVTAAKPNEFCRGDETHETCIIPKPEAGQWIATIHAIEAAQTNEYMFWASARTSVHFDLYIGTPLGERATGNPILLLGFLHQGGKPVEGKMAVNVYPVTGAPTGPVELFDDGQHGDGLKGDGIYGAWFLGGDRPGAYAARGTARGNDTAGKPFELFDNVTFEIKPRVLYVYQDDLATARAYEQLLEAHSLVVDLAVKHAVPLMNLRPYGLVIIGPDTGTLGVWEPAATVSAIIQSETPVLGLGEGGYAYFGQLKLNIGHPNGAHSQGTSIQPNPLTAADTIWMYPYGPLGTKDLMQLYAKPSGRVDVYVGDGPLGLQVFGYKDGDRNYADVVMESNWYMLWGFDDGPKAMTEPGRQLFVNTAFRTLR